MAVFNHKSDLHLQPAASDLDDIELQVAKLRKTAKNNRDIDIKDSGEENTKVELVL
jgi:hypothetical protein